MGPVFFKSNCHICNYKLGLKITEPFSDIVSSEYEHFYGFYKSSLYSGWTVFQ
jgi:hypothetical protein